MRGQEADEIMLGSPDGRQVESRNKNARGQDHCRKEPAPSSLAYRSDAGYDAGTRRDQPIQKYERRREVLGVQAVRVGPKKK